MNPLVATTNKINQTIFQGVHSNNLIYNTCWEDPRCDRELLELDASSNVVMITSAGCNALDYALDKPAQINCIDMNPRQNALLNLKKSVFQEGRSDDLYKMFGEGVHQQVYDFYKESLRPALPEDAQAYWDNNISFFIGKGIRKSFYWHSTSGLFAWTFSKFLKFQKKSYTLATRLFEAQNLDEQNDIYNELEPKLFNNFVKWAMSQQITMTMLGVPASQTQLLKPDIDGTSRKGREGVGFLEKRLRQVFTELPIMDNYFWQLYFNGKYTPQSTPNYLKSSNFEALKNQMPTIKTHNATITQFLQQNPSEYSHYVLLDHQDWLAANNRPALEEEWRNILANSRQGTKILLRSAAYQVDFFPDFVKERVVFEKEKTAEWHQKDRVGTYGSVYLGIVQN
jgi:S-adenosylmethionine-diacylglycerol 3-amino-3-carboxypropyl transferase